MGANADRADPSLVNHLAPDAATCVTWFVHGSHTVIHADHRGGELCSHADELERLQRDEAFGPDSMQHTAAEKRMGYTASCL